MYARHNGWILSQRITDQISWWSSLRGKFTFVSLIFIRRSRNFSKMLLSHVLYIDFNPLQVIIHSLNEQLPVGLITADSTEFRIQSHPGLTFSSLWLTHQPWELSLSNYLRPFSGLSPTGNVFVFALRFKTRGTWCLKTNGQPYYFPELDSHWSGKRTVQKPLKWKRNHPVCFNKSLLFLLLSMTFINALHYIAFLFSDMKIHTKYSSANRGRKERKT